MTVARGSQIQVRLSLGERDRLKALAAGAGLSLSDWVRRAVGLPVGRVVAEEESSGGSAAAADGSRAPLAPWEVA